MTTYANIILGASAFPDDVWEEYIRTQKEAAIVLTAMQNSLSESTQGKAYANMGMQFNHIAFSQCAVLKPNNAHTINLSFPLRQDFTRQAQEANAYIPEKTANVLLNGPLLTDEQKKKLINRLIPNLITPTETTDGKE